MLKFLQQNQQKNLPQGQLLHLLHHPLGQEFFSWSEKHLQINTCTKKYPKQKNQNQNLISLIKYEKILLAQGLPSKLQRMEHPETVVLQGRSTRNGTCVLFKKNVIKVSTNWDN